MFANSFKILLVNLEEGSPKIPQLKFGRILPKPFYKMVCCDLWTFEVKLTVNPDTIMAASAIQSTLKMNVLLYPRPVSTHRPAPHLPGHLSVLMSVDYLWNHIDVSKHWLSSSAMMLSADLMMCVKGAVCKNLNMNKKCSDSYTKVIPVSPRECVLICSYFLISSSRCSVQDVCGRQPLTGAGVNHSLWQRTGGRTSYTDEDLAGFRTVKAETALIKYKWNEA